MTALLKIKTHSIVNPFFQFFFQNFSIRNFLFYIDFKVLFYCVFFQLLLKRLSTVCHSFSVRFIAAFNFYVLSFFVGFKVPLSLMYFILSKMVVKMFQLYAPFSIRFEVPFKCMYFLMDSNLPFQSYVLPFSVGFKNTFRFYVLYFFVDSKASLDSM